MKILVNNQTKLVEFVAEDNTPVFELSETGFISSIATSPLITTDTHTLFESVDNFPEDFRFRKYTYIDGIFAVVENYAARLEKEQQRKDRLEEIKAGIKSNRAGRNVPAPQ